MIKITPIAIAAVFAVGCSPSTKEKKWSEQVDVGDGQIVMVKRAVEFETTNSWSGDAFGMKDVESKLTIGGQGNEVPPWITNLMPLVLYQDSTSHWVVVAGTFNCDTWYAHGKPRPPYWEYRLVKGEWVAQSISPESFSRGVNLFFRYEVEVPASPITIAVKNDILAHSMLEEKFKRFEPDAKPGC